MNHRKLNALAWLLVWTISVSTFGSLAAMLTWRFAWAAVCLCITCAAVVCYLRVERRLVAIEDRFALRSRRPRQ